jgi:hypothetical protein
MPATKHREIPKPTVPDPNRVDRNEREDFTLDEHRNQQQMPAKVRW